jgi:REP element-mobilizing transposase RayT
MVVKHVYFTFCNKIQCLNHFTYHSCNYTSYYIHLPDWDKDHVDLEWTPPKKDGGSPIIGYIIEKRTRFG